jgi:hypothetical protein
MKRAALVLFALGLIGYIAALTSIGTARGETYSDVGNGLLLVSVVLLLLRRESSSST